MRIQQINNNNTNFGNLKGIEGNKYFHTNSGKYLCAMDAILNSNAIVDSLGRKYNFLAKLEGSKKGYKLSLIPEPETNISKNKKPSWVERIMNFFHRKKEDSNHEFTGKINGLKREEHLNLPNLPKGILVCDISGKSEQDTFAKFIKSVKMISTDFFDSELKEKTKTRNPLRRSKK